MQCDAVGIDLPNPEDGKLRIYALDFPDAPLVLLGHKQLPRFHPLLVGVF
jgi:hypothetical protein